MPSAFARPRLSTSATGTASFGATSKIAVNRLPRNLVTMEPSPLTQDSRPEIFQPKIIRLYEQLFRVRFSSKGHPSAC